MKIESGTDRQSSDDFEWELHKGAGPRTHSAVIAFEDPFAVPPNVVVLFVDDLLETVVFLSRTVKDIRQQLIDNADRFDQVLTAGGYHQNREKTKWSST